jgi:hypothetical protein
MNAADFQLSRSGLWYVASIGDVDPKTGAITNDETKFVAAASTFGQAIAKFQASA